MKRFALIVILALVVSAFAADDPPAYTNGQQYAWNNATKADQALAFVNGEVTLKVKKPKKGNGKKIKPGVTVVGTTNWVTSVSYTNGWYFFPRIPPNVLRSMNISTNDQKLFFDLFTPNVKPKKVITIGD